MDSEVQLACFTCGLSSTERVGSSSRHAGSVGGIAPPPLMLTHLAHAEMGHVVRAWNLDYDGWSVDEHGYDVRVTTPPPDVRPIRDWPKPHWYEIRPLDGSMWSSCIGHECSPAQQVKGPRCPRTDDIADADLCEVCPRMQRIGRVGETVIRYVVCKEQVA